MNVNNRRVLAAARHVVGNVDESGDSPLAVPGKSRLSAAQPVNALGQRQGGGLTGSKIVQVDIGVAIKVCGPAYGSAVGRDIASGNLPLVLRQPVDFLRYHIEQPNIVVAIAGIRSDEQALAVRRKLVCSVEVLAFVRS